MGLKRIANIAMAVVLTAAVAMPGIGCATSKKVANTATFGLVGDKENIRKAKEEKQARKDAEKQAEQEREAEKKATAVALVRRRDREHVDWTGLGGSDTLAERRADGHSP